MVTAEKHVVSLQVSADMCYESFFFFLTFCIVKETSVAVFLIDGNALPLLMEAFVCGGRMPFSEKLLRVFVCVCIHTHTPASADGSAFTDSHG